MNVPEQLFQVLERDTPFCLCLAISVCEPVCLRLFTTQALIRACREADSMLSPDAVIRLKAEVVRRLLLAPLEEALPPPDVKAVLDASRLSVRGSDIWHEEGQVEIQDLLDSSERAAGLLMAALPDLRIPASKAGEGLPFSLSLPLVFSVRDFVASSFRPEARSALKLGLCIRAEIDLREDQEGRELHFQFEGVQPSHDVWSAVHRAVDVLRRERPGRTGFVVVRLPPILELLPVEGESLGFAFYAGFASALQDHALDPAVVLTGKLDHLDRVEPVGGIAEKLVAATEEGCRLLVYPHRERDRLPELPPPATKVATLAPGPAPNVLQQAWAVIDPRSGLINSVLEIAVMAVIVGPAIPFLSLWKYLDVSDAMLPWIASWTPGGLVTEAVFIGFGLPMTILFLLLPLMLVAVVYALLLPPARRFAAQLPVLRGRINLEEASTERIRVGLDPAPWRNRVARGAFRLAYYWTGWFLASAGVVACWYLDKAKKSSGIMRTPAVVQSVAALALLAAGIGWVVGACLVAQAARRRLERHFPALK